MYHIIYNKDTVVLPTTGSRGAIHRGEQSTSRPTCFTPGFH